MKYPSRNDGFAVARGRHCERNAVERSNPSFYLRPLGILRISLLLAVYPAIPASAGFFDITGNTETQPVQAPQNPAQITLSFAPLVKNAAPAVVNIYTQKKVVERPMLQLFRDPMFQQFFGNSILGQPRERIENSLGSGVIIKPDGLIVTNYHVVKESNQIKVVLSDAREFDGKVLVKDQKMDLALVKINAGNETLPVIELADSDKVEVGDLVLAIGNPFGVGQTVTHGIISALGRTAAGVSSGYQSFLQTDAAINPGNSGGALIGIDGKLVGINTAIYSRSGGSNGVGFATPSNVVQTVMKSLSHGGKIIRPWFGASLQRVTPDMAKAIGLDKPKGGIIGLVYPEGPAAGAGLKEGDVILQMDNYEIADEHDFMYRITNYDVGKTAKLLIWRQGQTFPLQLEMVAPPETPARDIRMLKGDQPLTGAMVANLSPALADEINMPLAKKGAVVLGVNKGSTAERLGFQNGDIIMQVTESKITSSEQLETLLAAPNQMGWTIVFERGGKTMQLQLRR